MSEPAITVEDLSKRYRIGQTHDRYRTLRDALIVGARRPLRRFRSNGSKAKDPFIWALSDLSFDVPTGDVLGIIGRNGAGKSTLLKVLSRITEPTRGRAILRGRVSSLLEVGTGFHPELTGRENVYLNGAILGMSRAEITKKFAEITDFAGVQRFIDTPVKRYSSGMQVRLAFAVAAHLEPEILLIDEVLAVGDAEFQKRCLGKISEVSRSGRTVILVSHNMGVVADVASRGVWIDDGRICFDGDIREAISRYLSSGRDLSRSTVDLRNHQNRLPGMKPLAKSVSIQTSSGTPSTDFLQTDEIVIELEYNTMDAVHLTGAGFAVYTIEGVRAGGFNTYMAYSPPHSIPMSGKVRFTFAAGQLNPGNYVLNVSLGSHPSVLQDKVDNVVGFTIHPSDIYGTGHMLTKEDGIAVLRADVTLDGI